MIEICRPRPEEAAAIEALLDRAFGPGRHAKTSYRYREGRPPLAELGFVAREAGSIVGSIAYWPVRIGKAGTRALLLGPLAVEPARKGDGIGSALMHHSLTAAAALGHRLVVLVGDPDYYSRFGFGPAATADIHMPGENPERLQVRELAAGALAGVHGDVLPWPQAAEAASRVA